MAGTTESEPGSRDTMDKRDAHPQKGDVDASAALAVPLEPLLRLVEIFWRGKSLIIGGTMACAVAAAIVALVLPETYEASAVLLLQPPPFKLEGDEMAELIPKTLEVQDYEILLKSDGILTQVAPKLRELSTWPEEDLLELEEISAIRERTWIQTRVTEKTAQRVTYSPAIVLRARAGSPEQARDLAQAWADVAVETAAAFYEKGKSGLIDFVQQRHDEARHSLQEVFEQQREVESRWQKEVALERLKEKTQQLSLLEDDYQKTKVDAQTAREEAAELHSQLASEDELVTLWKSPPMTAVFLDESLAKEPGKEGASEKTPGFQEQEVNPTYLHVRALLAEKESELKGLEEKERGQKQAVADSTHDVHRLLEANAQYSFQAKRLDREETAFATTYDMLAIKLEQAKIAESEQEALADIKVVSDAVVPDRKIAPARTVIVLVAALLGFAVACCGVLAREILPKIRAT